MPAATHTRRRIERKLPSLEGDVTNWRKEGRSWRWIALELGQQSGVRVSHATLINWFPDLNKPVHELVDSA